MKLVPTTTTTTTARRVVAIAAAAVAALAIYRRVRGHLVRNGVHRADLDPQVHRQ